MTALANGKLERWHGTVKRECIRPGAPLSVEDARRIVDRFVTEYNDARLHSAIGYVTPRDKLNGLAKAICDARDHKLETARERRRLARQAAHVAASAATTTETTISATAEEVAPPCGEPPIAELSLAT